MKPVLSRTAREIVKKLIHNNVKSSKDIVKTIVTILQVTNHYTDNLKNIIKDITETEDISIDINQYISTSSYVSNNEWEDVISVYHLILSLYMLTNKSLAHPNITEYINSQLRYIPYYNYLGEQDIIKRAINEPLYIRYNIIDDIAHGLSLQNNVRIVGKSGTGKRSIVLSLIRCIVLGRYPSLYNSNILVSPTTNQIDNALDSYPGATIICIYPDVIENKYKTYSSSNVMISQRLRVKKLAIYNDDELDDVQYNVIVKPTNKKETIEICKRYIQYIRRFYDLQIKDNVIEYIYECCERFGAPGDNPHKTINTIYSLMQHIMNIEGEYDDITNNHVATTNIASSIMIQHVSKPIIITIKEAEEYVITKWNLTEEVLASIMSSNSLTHLTNIKEHLLDIVYGQDEIINTFVKALWKRQLKFDTMKKPLSVMLLGSTGVGKTFIAKKMAQMLFGSEDSIYRIDMSEFSHSHEVSKLIGSPPGYVGSNQEGILTKYIKEKPYSIILLDEVEKAHHRIWDVFLQIFDDGIVNDNKGNTYDASKCIFILTSNLGHGDDNTVIGFGSPNKDKADVRDNIKQYFRPELINRLSKIMRANELSKDHMVKICSSRLQEIIDSSILDIEYTDEVPENIYDIANSSSNYNLKKYNARELHRAISDLVEDKIVDLLSSTDIIDENDKIFISSQNGNINITKKE